MNVNTCREGSVFLVELNNPPVNAIGVTVREGLQAALDQMKSQTGLSRVILTGKGKSFAAGGDLKEFDFPPVEPHLPDLIAQIESSNIPWIAVINGVALGGGCELALGCRFRIALPGCQIGLPEVTVGVVPGSGGTQRLPRLIGMGPALELISTGKTVPAEKALSLGLVDMVSDNPVRAAVDLPDSILLQAKNIANMPAPLTDAESIERVKAASTKGSRLVASQKAIELVAKASSLSLDEGLKLERKTFLALRTSEQACALRHIFFSERAAKAPSFLKSISSEISHVVVVGGGTMGSGIAFSLLKSKIHTSILETDSEAVDQARNNVEKLISASLKRDLITDSDAHEIRSRLVISADYGITADATLVIEAVFEDIQVKKSVFTTLEENVPKSTIMASNTSYLDINELANCLSDPSRMLGLHFFAPAHIMRLLEIVRGDATSDRALAVGYEIAKRLRKIPVEAGVCDGFIGNRILARYREAADTLLMDGASPWEIDSAMVDFGYAMGPYEAQDLSGLDIAFANRRRQDATRGPNRRYIPIADRMVQEGRLGRKTGCGWYQYSQSGKKQIDSLVESLIHEEANQAGIERRHFAESEIQERLVVAMINEATCALHEGIAQSASDIDLVTVFGYGFPRWRGGLMYYADSVGVDSILEKLEHFQNEDSQVWTPSPALYHCARNGLRLMDYLIK